MGDPCFGSTEVLYDIETQALEALSQGKVAEASVAQEGWYDLARAQWPEYLGLSRQGGSQAVARHRAKALKLFMALEHMLVAYGIPPPCQVPAAQGHC